MTRTEARMAGAEACAELLLMNARHQDIGGEGFNMHSGSGGEQGRHSPVHHRNKYDRITGWISQDAKVRF